MNARDEVPILNRLVWDYERDTMGKPLGKAEYTVYNGIVYRCTRAPLGGDQYHASTVRYAFGACLTGIPESSWVSCDAHGRVLQ
jgi:hypothetical protein